MSHKEKVRQIIDRMEKGRGYKCKQNYPLWLEGSYRRLDVVCFKDDAQSYGFEVEKNHQQFINARKLIKFQKLFSGKVCQLTNQKDDRICKEVFVNSKPNTLGDK